MVPELDFAMAGLRAGIAIDISFLLSLPLASKQLLMMFVVMESQTNLTR